MLLSDELMKLLEEGLGVYIDKLQMENDRVLEQQKCFSAFVKNDICNIDVSIFRTVGDNECNAAMYETNTINLWIWL